MDNIRNIIKCSIELKQLIASDEKLVSIIKEAANVITNAYKNGDAGVYFCGNGGSAADAQHLAAELSGRFYFDREPLKSEALHVNTSYLTAVANDYSYDEVYARMIKAVGRKGDVLVGISTSGNSENIVRAFKNAKALGITTIAFTGDLGGKMKDLADILINVPADKTPRIQEAHIMIGHIICEIVEESLFKI
jgi:D-sedoheptulose 7-phosphate isomerase